MKKIGHLVSTGEFSGAEKIAIEICAELNNYYDFTYICKEGPVINYLNNKNVKFITYKKKYQLISIFFKNKFDIIHAHDYRASLLAAILGGRKKIISHIHCNPPFSKKYNIKSILFFLASLNITKIVCVSNQVKKDMLIAKYIKGKVMVINNWINNREQLSEKNVKKDIDIIFVGRLSVEKNPIGFVKILNEINPKFKKKLVIKIIGKGELKEEVINLIEKLKLNIEVIGFKENVKDYMKRSKILFVPSKYEGFGLVFLEALLNECLPVGPKNSGLRDIFPKEYEFLAEDNNEYLSILEYLLNNNFIIDETIKRYKYVLNDYFMDNNVRKVIDLYE